MHPDLLNNSLFLRYYRQWQVNTTSIVFAPIAEFLLRYGLTDEALEICIEGLRHHPDFVSGRIILAKIYLARGDVNEGEQVLRRLLEGHPLNESALKLLKEVAAVKAPSLQTVSGSPPAEVSSEDHYDDEEEIEEEIDEGLSPGWRTITMAQIFTAQGHRDKARVIYESILSGDPENVDARRGLQSLMEF